MTLSGAEQYEIVVRGRLSSTLMCAFDHFTLVRVDDGLSHLVGWVRDQADLHRLLGVMQDLNIELESIHHVDA